MLWKEYPYLGSWSGNRLYYRPYVAITLFSSISLSKTIALVDSGSDGLILNSSFADDLGINLDLCEKSRLDGSTGVKNTRVCKIAYIVDGFIKTRIETQVTFVEDLPIPCLVGQEDFFSKFIVQFDKSINEFKLGQK